MSTLPVIAAVDGSDSSLRALDWALAETERRGTTLRVVHVRQYAPSNQTDVLVSGEEPPAVDPVLSQVRDRLADRAGLPPVEYLDYEGSPGSVIPGLGDSAQLIVLGSRGRGGFASLLLGSNGMAAARDAACPVVIVPQEGREIHNESEVEPGPRVVVGASVEAPDAHTLAFAFDAADRLGARVDVVSAFPWPEYVWTAVGGFVPSESDQQAAQDEIVALIGDIVAPYRAEHPDVRVAVVAAPGDAAGHIVGASKDAQLIVVGRHRRRLLKPARLLGSVTQAVLLHAASPVAVVPPEDGEDD
ncbi:universal stress protein [Streptomyces uncialis]|uniref:universal stress protein n=1 Tax=Streptomyces uncialis TaxID=1048205 RepID=UPI0037B1F8CB|nr:universal stress protein [Streptomyces uncialis]